MERKTDTYQLENEKATKGFTLMELLFVLLLIALIISFAVPTFRSVRFDTQNARAKTALQKLVSARRSFYQDTQGWNITPDTFRAQAVAGLSGSCASEPFSGIPGKGSKTTDFSQLFLCGYLNKKDFANLNYSFSICASDTSVTSCTGGVSAIFDTAYAAAFGNDAAAGKKYLGTEGYVVYMDHNMKVSDTEN